MKVGDMGRRSKSNLRQYRHPRTLCGLVRSSISGGGSTPTALPHHDSFPASWSDTHRLAIWGNPKSKGKKFIRGRMDNTTVPNEHWLFLEEKEGIRLSEFSISRITKAKQLRNTERPRCEKKWKTLLQDDTIDFDKVWGSVGTFLTSPAQEKHWFLLLHRN